MTASLVSATFTVQDLAEHCARLRGCLADKEAQLVGLDPRYAVFIRAQISALRNRVDEIEAALCLLSGGSPAYPSSSGTA